ncbi:hypothetical protein PCASD_10280 [Puccinia coronata f. sp. avenae]|uniref:Uncharacterized protein n=1 Tax=Puccinia coronata f. sp. avenae TaxID=200324 RepID=A0A2N5UIG5_9BASI|nr:hypothetical protein PCASD_10280 [Puccinia coronata f. sp. avenae]
MSQNNSNTTSRPTTLNRNFNAPHNRITTTTTPFSFQRNATFPLPNKSTSSNTTSDNNEYFQNAVKAKRKKTTPKSPYPKTKPAQSSSKNPNPPPSPKELFIDCGFAFYQNNKLKNNTGILNVMEKVNLTNPNLFDDLMESLWNVFAQELVTKSLVDQFPDTVNQYLSLSQGKSRLTSQEALIYVIRNSAKKKAFQIDLTYQHPDFEPTSGSDSSEKSSSDEDIQVTNSSSRQQQQTKVQCPELPIVDCRHSYGPLGKGLPTLF